MERLLRSLFFVLPFMASVEAHISDGLTAYPLPDQASAITESLVILGVLTLTVVHYSHEPKLTFPEYDLPDYRILLKSQQAEMERIHKIAAEEMAMGRLKIKITEATTDEDTARRVYIAKTNGITVREQKDIEQEAKRHREDAHAQPDGSAMEGSDILLPDDNVLCLASTRKACREVLSKIVSCAHSEPDTTRENTSDPSQEDAQGAPAGQERNHSGEDGSVVTAAGSTTKDLEPSAKKQKLQQTASESELAEITPQQLLNKHLVGFRVLATPMDNFCWLHAIRLSSGQPVLKLIETLIAMINHHLPDNEQAQASGPSDFISRWISAQGEKNVRLVRKQLVNEEWPDFDILLPLLSALFKKTFVVVNLHTSGLINDQVFTYATSNNVRVVIVSEASAINTSEERVYLGLLSKNNHFVGIRPGTPDDTRNDDHSHDDPDCLNKSTESRAIESSISDSEIPTEPKIEETQKQPHLPVNQEPRRPIQLMCAFEGCNYRTDDPYRMEKHKYAHQRARRGVNVHLCDHEDCDDINCDMEDLELTPPPIPEPHLLCDYEGCNYADYYEPNLRMHKLIHRPVAQAPNVHRCAHEGCNYRTDNVNNLNRHRLTHRPAAPPGRGMYRCHREGCNYSTDYFSHLERHILTHIPPDLRPKVHYCNHDRCFFSTRHEAKLKRHKRKHYCIEYHH
ncbi:hypothetical protein [Endozoicomonas sp. 4G]|uniref:hypothetical protein n=1 Tax=Endozoicomonas sp. 4G TaxID=2872754 RepID=UPI0020789912|nr:hypothetical protein [Endozoicomonas sp. 4G]